MHLRIAPVNQRWRAKIARNAETCRAHCIRLTYIACAVAPPEVLVWLRLSWREIRAVAKIVCYSATERVGSEETMLGEQACQFLHDEFAIHAKSVWNSREMSQIQWKKKRAPSTRLWFCDLLTSFQTDNLYSNFGYRNHSKKASSVTNVWFSNRTMTLLFRVFSQTKRSSE